MLIIENPAIQIENLSLYIVDRKETTEDNFEKILPENIKTINILKKESAINKYVDKGKKGVIETTTNK